MLSKAILPSLAFDISSKRPKNREKLIKVASATFLVYGETIMFKIVFAFFITLMILFSPSYVTMGFVKQPLIDFKQVQCLADNIYYEAASESFEGKLAVAQVTLNRLKHPLYPSDLCSVIKQKTNQVCQFSWVCNKIKLKKDPLLWEDSWDIAMRAVSNTAAILHEGVEDAIFYHANYVNPGWNYTKTEVIRIGKHIFYRSK